jgi:hypothetical protein
VYNAEDFRRRFRISKQLFDETFLQQKLDATGKRGPSARLKLTAALRVLAYGCSYDQVDEIVEMSKDMVRLSFLEFCKFVDNHYSGEIPKITS